MSQNQVSGKICLFYLTFMASIYIVSSFAAPSPFTHKPIELSPYFGICSANMACKFSVCLWSQDLTITDDNCHHLNNQCSCGPQHECRLTEYSEPTSLFVTWEYRCLRRHASNSIVNSLQTQE